MTNGKKFLKGNVTRKHVTMAEIAAFARFENLTPEIDLNGVFIHHRNVNRPQLFLTGFESHFDNERLQIFGSIEAEYLSQFSEEEREYKFERLFATGIPGIIVSGETSVYPEMLKIAKKYNMPVLLSSHGTAKITVDLIGWIDEQLAPTVTVYGVFVDVYGEGILITGVSGIGKSETAVELIKRGHRLVADDLVEICKVGESLLIGRAPELTQHFVEIRGIGIVDVKSLYGVESVRDRASIDMMIDLEEWDSNKNYDRLGLNEEYEDILGVQVVKHTVPIRTGRNLAIIIETAAVNNRQKKMGYNAAKELCDRVSANIHREHEKENNGGKS
ncbi:MAG: HPr(Ser) kinase/phosphatase [Lachnospiraceae bacterium]